MIEKLSFAESDLHYNFADMNGPNKESCRFGIFFVLSDFAFYKRIHA
jgi:hypothetical protein